MTQGAETAGLLAELPPLSRLATAYAPAAARPLWVALLAFDQRLERSVEGASSPLIGQLKLAWWRDRMRTSAAQWPKGEPLLAALIAFDGGRGALEALVDGWEGMLDEDAGTGAMMALAEARGGAVVALAAVLGCVADRIAISEQARRWTGTGETTSPPARLPRALRPLTILAHPPDPAGSAPLALLRIVRLGLFGR